MEVVINTVTNVKYQCQNRHLPAKKWTDRTIKDVKNENDNNNKRKTSVFFLGEDGKNYEIQGEIIEGKESIFKDSQDK